MDREPDFAAGQLWAGADMLGIDRSDDRGESADAPRPVGRRSADQQPPVEQSPVNEHRAEADANAPDRSPPLVLRDASLRRQYALAYQAKVKAANRAAEQRQPEGGDRQQDAEQATNRPDTIHDTPDLAKRYPDDYVPWPEPPKSVERPQVLENWLVDVNPDKTDRGRQINCGECARAVAKTWFGDTATPAAVADPYAGGEPANRMSEWAGQRPVSASMAEIGRRLTELGAGSLAVVGFNRLDFGHWFNAVNRDGTVLAVDGQSGSFAKWPPSSLDPDFDESKMLRSDAIFFAPDGKVVRDDH